MTHFKFIGFWQEYTKNPNHSFLSNIEINIENVHKSIYLDYLNKGNYVFGIRSVGINLLSITPKWVFAYDFFTDGVWIWSSALIYYLDKHNIDLPMEFTTHILANIDDEQIVSKIMDKEFINNIHSAVRYEMRFFT